MSPHQDSNSLPLIICNRSRVQSFRGLGLFLAFCHPCLKIDMPSASPHSSLPATELALE